MTSLCAPQAQSTRLGPGRDQLLHRFPGRDPRIAARPAPRV